MPPQSYILQDLSPSSELHDITLQSTITVCSSVLAKPLLNAANIIVNTLAGDMGEYCMWAVTAACNYVSVCITAASHHLICPFSKLHTQESSA